MVPSEPQGKVALQWAGVSVAFGDRTVLHEVDLQVRQGETLALVGESGSGKTLCCMAALGLLPKGGMLTHGRITGPVVLGPAGRVAMSCPFRGDGK